MTANTLYLLQMFVTIYPDTSGTQLTASIDPTFSSAAQGGSFSFSPGVTSPVPVPASWTLMLLGLGALGATVRRRRGRFSH